MSTMKIPHGPEAVTADWLTQALRSTGVLGAAAVTSFESQIIGEGMGIIGQLARLHLSYDATEPNAPSQLIAKFPTALPENRAIGMLFRFYEREIRFYEELADAVSLRTPRCYHHDMNVEAEAFILLLEDLTPARGGNQVEGCSVQEAELAIQHLAQFHADWWEHERLSTLDWMPLWYDPERSPLVQGAYQQSWGPFVDNFGQGLSDAILTAGEQLNTRIISLVQEIAKPPRTIMHGDYRIDNLFFASSAGGAPLSVIDWQIVARGRGVFDVGYFMSQSLAPEIRKSEEMRLLEMYHGILTDRGVNHYSFEVCVHDYRKSILLALIYPVIVCGSLDLSNDRGYQLATTIVKRSTTAIEELDAAELMPQ